jgi:DNA polymerase
MNKADQLRTLETEIVADKNLPLQESNLVFGEGNIDCQVCFIGEAPGFNEDQLRRPFVGRAGKLLDKLIGEIGWKREDVYITNIVKRRPPDNRDPLPEEIEAYKPYLARQIEILNPKIIATLGRFSMNYFLPFAKISRDRGKVFEANGRIIFPLYHPAAALRATAVLEDLRADFKKLPDVTSGKITSDSSVEIPPLPPSKNKKVSPPQAKLF